MTAMTSHFSRLSPSAWSLMLAVAHITAGYMIGIYVLIGAFKA